MEHATHERQGSRDRWGLATNESQPPNDMTEAVKPDTPERLSPAAVTPKRELSMMAWLATEGGRKCPQCGKYAKESELGYTGGLYEIGGVLTHISSYGHLEGYGCNRSQARRLSLTHFP